MPHPHYVYTPTTQKLAELLATLDSNGQEPVHFQYLGGRDWVVIAREYLSTTAPPDEAGAPVREVWGSSPAAVQALLTALGEDPTGSAADRHQRAMSVAVRLGRAGWRLVPNAEQPAPAFPRARSDEDTVALAPPGDPFLRVGSYHRDSRQTDADGAVRRLPWRGWVEDDAATWILYLDAEGRPGQLWMTRDADGGTLGDGVDCSTLAEHRRELRRWRALGAIIAGYHPAPSYPAGGPIPHRVLADALNRAGTTGRILDPGENGDLAAIAELDRMTGDAPAEDLTLCNATDPDAVRRLLGVTPPPEPV